MGRVYEVSERGVGGEMTEGKMDKFYKAASSDIYWAKLEEARMEIENEMEAEYRRTMDNEFRKKYREEFKKFLAKELGEKL